MDNDEIFVYLENETAEKFNMWLKDCFQELDIFYKLRFTKSGVSFIFRSPEANQRKYSILAFYIASRRHEGAIRLDSLEVGSRLKVTISHTADPKFILPVLDILIDLYKDFPEARGNLLSALRVIKKKYQLKISLRSSESFIYQTFASTDADTRPSLAELVQLWNNDVDSTEQAHFIPFSQGTGNTEKPETKKKILFEGTLPTTPKILFDALHDFWLNCSTFLEKTAISGMKFNLERFDEFFSRINIQLGQYITGLIASIDIRRLNDNLVKISIPSTEGTVTWFHGEEWDNISSATDKFLLGFASYLKEMYFGEKETEDTKQDIKHSAADFLLGQADKTQNGRTRGEPGRRHAPDDVWAWEQVNKYKQPMNEVYSAWEEREGVVSRNLADPRRQFNRITKPEWGQKTK